MSLKILRQTQFASHKQDYTHSATISRVQKSQSLIGIQWFGFILVAFFMASEIANKKKIKKLKLSVSLPK